MACAMMAPCGARAARAQSAAQARAGARPPRRARVVAMATRRSAREHVVLVSTLVPKEGHEAELRELCDGVVHWAAKSVGEPHSGVEEFYAHKDEFDEGVVHFWQRFTGPDAMGKLHNNVVYASFLKKASDVLREPMSMGMYRYLDGKISCMMHPYGPKGEGGVDDATGQAGMAGGAGYQQHVKVDITADVNREEESGGRIWTGVVGKMKGILDAVQTS